MSDETPVTPPESPPPAPPAPAADEVDSTSKLLGLLSYLFGIVAIIVLLIDPYKAQRFSRLHAVQALALWVAAFVANILWSIPVIGWIIAPIASIAIFVLAIIGAINAFQGKYWELPVLHGYVKGFIEQG